jgi:hypothetical protein
VFAAFRGAYVLLALPLLDEFSGGLSVASVPTFSRATGARLALLSSAILAAPMLSGLLEAPILAWTDRRKTKRHVVVAVGVFGIALSLSLVSMAHGVVGLALASALYGPMSGIALGTGEAMLVDGVSADVAARRLARWSLFASLGDVLAPAVVLLANAAGIAWTTPFRVAAIGVFGVGALVLLVPAGWAERDADRDAERDASDPSEPLLTALRGALGNRRLFAWLAGAAVCTLLDEVLAVLAAVWASTKFSIAATAPMLIAFSLGAALGAAILERALARVSRSTALVVASSACLAAMGAWLSAATLPVALVCSGLVGMTAQALHPLAKAEAFAVLPSRPGLVNGASQAFIVLDLLAPALLAWVAERYGAGVALSLLSFAPLMLLSMGVVERARSR